MASDDVLIRHMRLKVAPTHAPVEVWQQLADDLAAEVRALRKDSERLEWMLENYPGHYLGNDEWGFYEDRAAIDSAMAKEAGE